MAEGRREAETVAPEVAGAEALAEEGDLVLEGARGPESPGGGAQAGVEWHRDITSLSKEGTLAGLRPFLVYFRTEAERRAVRRPGPSPEARREVTRGSTQLIAATPTGSRIGPFEVLGELGRGGMGAVFRVRHISTGAPYALKLLLPGLVESESGSQGVARFQREIEALAKLDGHPSIVRLFTHGRHGMSPYYVMELVEGETLKDACGEKPMDPDRAVRIAISLARAVHHAHVQGVLHRDLKPSNVLLDQTGTPRILDFGLAKSATDTSLTKTGEMMGTPGYMSPEQVGAGGEKVVVGPTTDVYGLGSLLYHLLVGHRPFKGMSRLNTIAAVLTKHPTPPRSIVPELSPELEAVCLKAMEKEPEDRYRSAGAFADDLERWVGGESVSVRPLGRVTRVARRFIPARGPRRAAAIVSVMAASALAAGSIFVVVFAAGTHVSASAGRAAHEEVTRLLAELEVALADARRGDVDAIDEAFAIEERLGKLDIDATVIDPDLPEVLRGYRKLQKGDPVFVRTVTFDAPPWANRADAVIEVLAAAGHTRELGVLLEREPGLLAKVAPERIGGLAESLRAAIVDGTLALNEKVTRGLDATLEGAAREIADGPARAILGDLHARVLAGRIAAMVPEFPGGGSLEGTEELAAIVAVADELGEWVEALERLGRVHGVVDEEVLARLVTFLSWVQLQNADPGKLWTVADATLRLLPPDDERLRGLQTAVMAFGFNAQAPGSDRPIKEAGFEAGVYLFERGASWPWVGELADIGRLIDVPGLIRDELGRGERADAGRLATLLAVAVAIAEAARPEDDRAEMDAVLKHWDVVDLLVRRILERPDTVPPFAVTVVAFRVMAIDAWQQSGSLANLSTTEAAALRETLRRIELPATSEGLRRLLEALMNEALARLPTLQSPWWRHKTVLYQLRWRASLARANHEFDLPVELGRLVARDARELGALKQFEESEDKSWGMRVQAITNETRDDLVYLVGLILRRNMIETRGGGRPSDLPAWDAAIDELVREAGPIVPRCWLVEGVRAMHHVRAGRPDAAIAALRAGIDDDIGTIPRGVDSMTIDVSDLGVDIGRVLLANLLAQRGRRGEARAELEKTRDEGLGRVGLSLRAEAWRLVGDQRRAAMDQARAQDPRTPGDL